MTAHRVSAGLIRSRAANWGRQRNTMDHRAKLIPPQYAKLFSVFEGLPFQG